MIREHAYAKLNLVLHVGAPRRDGMHPLCSLLASIDLADVLEVEEAPDEDSVECPAVSGPNLALAALAAFRQRAGDGLPPLRVEIHKRIPVAAGLGGGSADAAAVLRAVNRLSGSPLGPRELGEVAIGLGSDVPAQLESRHALVQGIGELVEPVELPALAALVVPAPEGLETRAVYEQLDRMGAWRPLLDPEPLRRLAGSPPELLAAALDNDLQPAALALRPELADTLALLRAAGALGAAVSGSGPTCFGLFADRAEAERAAETVRGGLVAGFRDLT
jgi:4-diphosphocytidyl-2-C-methyl-D-erythritol kinase